MVRLSSSIIIVSITLVAFSLFSGVSFAISPGTLPNTTTTPGVLGFTPTPTPTPTQPPGGEGSRPPSIPEPTTIILTSLGLAGLAGYVARKKQNDSDDSPEL